MSSSYLFLDDTSLFFRHSLTHKVQVINNPSFFFNQDMVVQTSAQIHLGIFSNSKSNFSKHLKSSFKKEMKP